MHPRCRLLADTRPRLDHHHPRQSAYRTLHRRRSRADRAGARRRPQCRGVLIEFPARYTNGLTADVRDVLCVIDLAADPIALVILDAQSRELIDRWPALEVYLLHSRMVELRIANRQKP